MFCISDELLGKLLLPQRIPLDLVQRRTNIKGRPTLCSLICFAALLLLWKQVSWKLGPEGRLGAACHGRESREKMGGVRGWVEGTQGLWDGKELSWGWFSLSSALGEQPRDPWASLHTLCPACALAPDGPTELCMEGKARISLMSSLKS